MKTPSSSRVPTTREVLDALDWVRREIIRLRAPDQGVNGPRERSAQKLLRRLLRRRNPGQPSR